MSAHAFTVEPLDATFGAMVTDLRLVDLDDRAALPRG